MAQLVVGLFAGILGVAYMMYGKKEARISALVCGAALLVYPYFFTSWLALIAVGAALLVAPFFIDH